MQLCHWGADSGRGSARYAVFAYLAKKTGQGPLSPSPSFPGARCLAPCRRAHPAWLPPLSRTPTLCSVSPSPRPAPCSLTNHLLFPSPRNSISPLSSFEPVSLFLANYESQTWHCISHPSNKQENKTTCQPPTTPANHKLQVLPNLVSGPRIVFKRGLLLSPLFCKQPSWLSSIRHTSHHTHRYRSTASFLIAA